MSPDNRKARLNPVNISRQNKGSTKPNQSRNHMPHLACIKAANMRRSLSHMLISEKKENTIDATNGVQRYKYTLI